MHTCSQWLGRDGHRHNQLVLGYPHDRLVSTIKWSKENRQCGRRVRPGVWVAFKVGNLHSKFGHARPLGSWIIRYVYNGQTDEQKQCLLFPSVPTVVAIIILEIKLREEKACSHKIAKMWKITEGRLLLLLTNQSAHSSAAASGDVHWLAPVGQRPRRQSAGTRDSWAALTAAESWLSAAQYQWCYAVCWQARGRQLPPGPSAVTANI